MNKDQKEFRKLAREAVKLFRKEEWGASIAIWDEIILSLQDDKLKASALTRRGYAKTNMGDHEAAIADHDRAIGINPQYARAYNNRGNVKYNMGDYKGAITNYDQAIGINPQYARAYSNRGAAKDNMGDHEDAIADYDRAIEISPQHANAYNNRGVAKRNIGDYEGAIADYDRALEIDPDHKNAFRNRAVARAMQGSQEESQKIKGQLQAQLRTQLQAQQKQFASKMQEQVQALEKKLDEKFEEKFQAAEDIAEALGYDDNFKDYNKKAQQLGMWVWGLSGALALAAIAVYGYIACFGIEAWQAAQSPMAMSNFSALSLFPFILMGTLLLSPLVWVIRMLNRDKHKCWVLREDALANLTLARIIKSYPTLRKELSERLFEHHDKRGSASLIADWNRADTGGNSVSVQDILNLVKPGDKGSN